jgi:signal transduction histidine kinase
VTSASAIPRVCTNRYVDLVSWFRRILRTHGVAALLIAAAVAGALGTAARTDPLMPTGPAAWAEALAVAAVVLLLLLRRRYPFAAPAAVWVASAALSFVDGKLITSQGVVFIVGLAAALLLGNLRDDVKGRIGLLIVVGGALVIVFNDPSSDAGDLTSTTLMFAISWLVGYVLRERLERTEAAEQRAALVEQRAALVERDRMMTARVAAAEERTRIARELHDVVAHAVSMMVLQVGAVRHRMTLDDGEDPRETLENAEQAGRRALAEMRRLLVAMRQDDDQPELLPTRGLDDLATLTDEVRGAGLDVRLHVHGDTVPLPPGLDLSAYRIVQEALTNTLKHAHASRAVVEVTYGCGDIEIVVSDDGRGPTSSDGRGHGLVGISERVRLYGGDMTAGASATGGFEVRARIPLDGVNP